MFKILHQSGTWEITEIKRRDKKRFKIDPTWEREKLSFSDTIRIPHMTIFTCDSDGWQLAWVYGFTFHL